MYKNVESMSRATYAKLLKEGIKFKNWSFNEPANNPKRTYYIVELDGEKGCLLYTSPSPRD